VLVQASAGEDLTALKQRLESALPGTRALTRQEMAFITEDYWQRRTGIGFVLGLGAVVGVVVGIVVVSQILYASVSDHIREFGTLKAMGASDWVIYRVITEQALWMAVLGYLPSMALCIGLGYWTMAAKGIMILITPATAAGVLGITIVMCVGSALFAIQKVTHVDPAIVFKA
jgi:putative ABC transport system permease protein